MFVPNFDSWCDYADNTARNGTYGDHITLGATAELFNVDIVILSSLGRNANTVVSPSSGASFGTVYLGHLARGRGNIICASK